MDGVNGMYFVKFRERMYKIVEIEIQWRRWKETGGVELVVRR